MKDIVAATTVKQTWHKNTVRMRFFRPIAQYVRTTRLTIELLAKDQQRILFPKSSIRNQLRSMMK